MSPKGDIRCLPSGRLSAPPAVKGLNMITLNSKVWHIDPIGPYTVKITCPLESNSKIMSYLA